MCVLKQSTKDPVLFSEEHGMLMQVRAVIPMQIKIMNFCTTLLLIYLNRNVSTSLHKEYNFHNVLYYIM